MKIQVKKFPPLQQMDEAIQKSSLPDLEKRIARAYAVVCADRQYPVDHYNALFARMALVDWPIPPDKRSQSLSLIANVFSSLTPVSDPVQEVSESLPVPPPHLSERRPPQRVPSNLLDLTNHI